MIDDAKKSTLGKEVLKEHQNLRGTAKLAANLNGDVALVSLNQKLVELERLNQMQSTQGSESDFNEYQDQLMNQIMAKKMGYSQPVNISKSFMDESQIQKHRVCRVPLKNARHRFIH